MAKRFGVMLDMSRNAVMRPEQVKKFAALAKKLGYNMIQLYTEDTYEIPEEKYFGYLRGRYSQEEMRDIVAYCSSIGMEVIPCIQTLAHLNQTFHWKTYWDIHDIDDILLADEERSYELIENMFKSIRSCFTSDTVHIGMDEAHMLGLGKYLDKHGVKNRFDILHNHLQKVIEIAKKYGFKPIMWSDMFFRLANHDAYVLSDPSIITDEVIASRPDGVDLIYWDYYQDKKSVYDTMLEAHAKFGGEVWFAGGAWTWSGFASGNGWSLKSMLPAMQSCKEHNVDNIFITLWGDDGKECSYYSVLPALYAIRRAYEGVSNTEQIKKEFYELTGESFDNMMLLDMPVDFGKINRDNSSYHKYLLYSDCFLGYLDPLVKQSKKQEYLDLADKLEDAAKGSCYAYLFESQAALCRLLAIKHDLGVRTRKAYKSGDKVALAAVADDYQAAIEALETFHLLFRKLWFEDNKPHGFDVQELRLGGLMLRLRSQQQRLREYVDGKTQCISELDEELLDYNGRYSAGSFDMPCLNHWWMNASINVI